MIVEASVSVEAPVGEVSATSTGCCGPTVAALSTPAQDAAVEPCCGTAAEAAESDACCGAAAKATAVTTGAGCCG